MTRGSLLNASIGDYRLVSFLGAGGMGEVYRAIHAKLDRAVAIKLLSVEERDSAFLQRFWNEARLHASLHHPNIAELYDFLEYDGRPCIVMEYVDGEALSDRIRPGGLPLPEVLPVFQALTAAMAYVHEQGIVHRDLKAANVRISSRGVVKLLDFGIAKGGATPPLTKTGAVIGTLLYMAPEQLRGEGATPRSDVWSLGVVLYEMVTGRLPFQARAVGELLDKLTSASYERPSASCAEGSAAAPTDLREVDRIVGRCLRRDPADRYASAGELLQDLSRLASRPAESVAPAAPEPRADTLLRPIDALSKYWAPLVAVAAALVLVVVGFLLWPSSEPGTMPAEPVPPPAAPAAGATDQPVARTTHRIDVAVGQADVYVNGTLRGRTPFDYQATRGETIRLELRQEGFAPLQETFEVTERPVWTFAMTRRVPDRQP